MTLDSQVLVFSRCLGFFSRAPGFSNKSVPTLIRVAFSLAFAFLLIPTIPQHPKTLSSTYIFAVLSEFMIGSIIGFASAILFNGLDAGGQALDDFVGIRGVNPAAGPMAGVGFGRLWSFVFLTAYFQLGGYALPLMVFADGMRDIPPGAIIDPNQWMTFAVKLPALIVRAALLVAGPALVIGMLAQFALGAIARIVPRFSTQQISFGVTFAVVMLVTVVSLPLAGTLASRSWIPLPLPGVSMPAHR